MLLGFFLSFLGPLDLGEIMELDLLSLTHLLVPIIISPMVLVVLVYEALCNRLVQNWLHKHRSVNCFT